MEFLKLLKKKYNTDSVIHIGDDVDTLESLLLGPGVRHRLGHDHAGFAASLAAAAYFSIDDRASAAAPFERSQRILEKNP